MVLPYVAVSRWRRPHLTAAAVAVAIAVAELSPVIPHDRAPQLDWWIAGIAMSGAAASVWLVLRTQRRRLISYLPLPLFLLAVQLLRAADGDGAAGFTLLLILPVAWYALYGTRSGLWLSLAGVAAVQFVPLIVVGAPQYPAALWQAGLLWVVILGLVGLVAQDRVAALRAKSAALASSEAQFRTALSDAPTGIALIGATGAAHGVFLRVNRALAALLGHDEADLVGRSVLEFTHPEDRTLTQQHLLAPPERQVGQTLEKRYLHSSGRPIPVKITYSRVDAGLGSDPYLVAHVEEITRRDLAGRRDQVPAAEGAPVDIDAVVRTAIDSIRPIARSRDLALQVDTDLVGGTVRGEADELERVVISLLDNAVKFTPPGGAIDVQARVRADTVILDVTDTGIGIDPDEQDRIFDRFYRARTAARSAIPGSGLGLTLAKAITEHHHGALRAYSEPGAGSTFTLTLPLCQDRPSA